MALPDARLSKRRYIFPPPSWHPGSSQLLPTLFQAPVSVFDPDFHLNWSIVQ